MKIKMILDTKGERGGVLFSNTIHNVSDNFGKELIANGKAFAYDEIRDAKRIVNLNGKEMTWGEYLKYRRKK